MHTRIKCIVPLLNMNYALYSMSWMARTWNYTCSLHNYSYSHISTFFFFIQIFEEIRSRHISNVFGYLSTQAKTVQSGYEVRLRPLGKNFPKWALKTLLDLPFKESLNTLIIYKYWLFMRGIVDNYCPEVKFTKGAVIFYHSPNIRAVNICFIHPIYRIFSPLPNCKMWKVGYQVPNSIAVAASLKVREMVNTYTHGLVSKHEHGQN